VLRQYRHQAEDQRQFPVAAVAKVEAHGTLVERRGLHHLGIIAAEVGAAVIAQELPGKNHVSRRHRHTVGKMRRRIEREGDVAARLVGVDRARQQAVKRKRLVIAARHQAFDHVAAHPERGHALDDERIEAVESSEHALHKAAALRRIGLGIRQHSKVTGHGRGPMHGDRGGGFRHCRRAASAKRQSAPQRGTCNPGGVGD